LSCHRTLSRYTKYFSILASYLRRYSYLKIDSPLLFTTESRCSANCLLRRVETPRVVYYGESPMIIHCKNSPHCLLRRVVTPQIVYYAELQLKWAADRGESKLCILLTTVSHHPHQLFWQKHPWSLKIRWLQSNLSIWMKFSEKHAIRVFYTQNKFHCFVYDTLLFRMFLLLVKFGEFLFAKIKILRKVLNLFEWNCQKSMQLKYSTHRKNCIASSIIL